MVYIRKRGRFPVFKNMGKYVVEPGFTGLKGANFLGTIWSSSWKKGAIDLRVHFCLT